VFCYFSEKTTEAYTDGNSYACRVPKILHGSDQTKIIIQAQAEPCPGEITLQVIDQLLISIQVSNEVKVHLNTDLEVTCLMNGTVIQPNVIEHQTLIYALPSERVSLQCGYTLNQLQVKTEPIIIEHTQASQVSLVQSVIFPKRALRVKENVYFAV
jgi:hypothetical protein